MLLNLIKLYKNYLSQSSKQEIQNLGIFNTEQTEACFKLFFNTEVILTNMLFLIEKVCYGV